MTQLIEGQGYQAKVVRSRRRKTVALEVKRGEVTVRAPYYVSAVDLKDFVKRRELWLLNVLQKHEALPPKPVLNFSKGAAWNFLGDEYYLSPVLNSATPKSYVEIESRNLVVYVKESSIEQKKLIRMLAAWYKNQAESYIAQRVAFYSEKLSLKPRHLKVRKYKSRWGSCNSRGELSFNWLIMMAPKDVIDYVVVHELCHLKHFDHSPQFWRLVSSILPNYKTQKRWLNQQTHLHWDEE